MTLMFQQYLKILSIGPRRLTVGSVIDMILTMLLRICPVAKWEENRGVRPSVDFRSSDRKLPSTIDTDVRRFVIRGKGSIGDASHGGSSISLSRLRRCIDETLQLFAVGNLSHLVPCEKVVGTVQ